MTLDTATPALSAAHRMLLEQVPLGEHTVVDEEVVAYEHDGQALEGFLLRDMQAEERVPAVLVLHDETGPGDTERMRAHMLARSGYAALAADLYGTGVRPTGAAATAQADSTLRNLDLLRARVAAGFGWLQQHPAVDPARLAVIGYGLGGTAALEFARTGAPVRGVASFHGRPIAHQPSDAADIAAALLILTGGMDPLVPHESVTALTDELRSTPHLDWQLIVYSGCPHAFTSPGTDAYRPVADARSWRALACFLEEVFA